MTPAELATLAEQRHGPSWYSPLAEETGWSVSHLWRIAHEGRPVSPKLEKAIRNLKPKRKAITLLVEVKARQLTHQPEGEE